MPGNGSFSTGVSQSLPHHLTANASQIDTIRIYICIMGWRSHECIDSHSTSSKVITATRGEISNISNELPTEDSCPSTTPGASSSTKDHWCTCKKSQSCSHCNKKQQKAHSKSWPQYPLTKNYKLEDLTYLGPPSSSTLQTWDGRHVHQASLTEEILTI